jgi:hypothetical protein
MISLPATIYLLCLAASVICAWLLIRSYIRTGMRLLLWSAACFVFLALNNLLVVVDILVTGPSIDLSIVRQLSTLIAVSVLLYGFIWELD